MVSGVRFRPVLTPIRRATRCKTDRNKRTNWGGRVVAAGTTVVRALETAARPDGSVDGAEGWTDLMITRERRLRTVDGLITGCTNRGPHTC